MILVKEFQFYPQEADYTDLEDPSTPDSDRSVVSIDLHGRSDYGLRSLLESDSIANKRSGKGSEPSSSIVTSTTRSVSNTVVGKFYCLPCRTFLATGRCPYYERCVFLHDPRCLSSTSIIYTPRTETAAAGGYPLKSREKPSSDALFWPPLPAEESYRRMNNSSVYSVPEPKSVNNHTLQKHPSLKNGATRRDGQGVRGRPQNPRTLNMKISRTNTCEAVFSLWGYFIRFCSEISSSYGEDLCKCQKEPRVISSCEDCQQQKDRRVSSSYNDFTGRPRLPFLRSLSLRNKKPVLV